MCCSIFENKTKKILNLRDHISDEQDRLKKELILHCKNYDMDTTDPRVISEMYMKIVTISKEMRRLNYIETILTEVFDDGMSCHYDDETLISYIEHGVFII